MSQHGRVVSRMTFLGVISLIGTITSRHSMNRLLGSYMRANNHSLTILLSTGFYFIHFDTDHLNLGEFPHFISSSFFSCLSYLEFCIFRSQNGLSACCVDNVCLVRTFSAASASFI